MDKKILKPKNCKECVVVRKLKGQIQCGCEPKLQATNPQEEKEMWNKCPLVWDKE